jgi:hypothetical protein
VCCGVLHHADRASQIQLAFRLGLVGRPLILKSASRGNRAERNCAAVESVAARSAVRQRPIDYLPLNAPIG